MIIFDTVTKTYGTRAVLDRVSCSISGGEFVCLIGASGAGKSTFLHALIGAVPITSGRITIDGIPIQSLKEDDLALFKRRLGVIFQDFRLLPHKTVAENVALPLEVASFPKKAVHDRVHAALTRVGCEAHAKRFPRELSGGEQQRVAIARAIVHDPALIIADEPTGNLDPKTAEGIITLLSSLHDSGMTVLLATHDSAAVDRLEKRVIKLASGKLISDRTGTYIHD